MSTDFTLETPKPLDLKKYGCEELWLFSGDGWAIPVYAFHLKGDSDPREFAWITPAVRLNAGQHYELKMAIEKYTQSEEKWIVMWQDLEIIAKKCPGIRPLFYFKWEGSRDATADGRPMEISVPAETVDGAASGEAEEFVRHLASKTSSASHAQLKVIFSAMCREMFHWIYEREKVVDFGFAKMSALPYRVNWKEVMCSLFPKMTPVFCRKDKDLLLLQSGMEEQITAGTMVGMTKATSFVDWTIEIEHTKEWRRLISNGEKTRLSILGAVRYRKWWATLVNRLRPRIWKLYESWIQKTNASCADDSSVSRSGRDILMPERKAKWLRPKAYRPCTLSAVHDGSTPAISNADRKRHNVVKAIEVLPPVPNLPEKIRDMWKSDWDGPEDPTRLELGQSRDREKRANGLPMLHAGEGAIEC